ncbi:hypothetical protein L6Q21_12275 [Sandaracinobacter sp. RS1-74]|uniref:lipopolysaccharide biosynthesis protein n=1 Tax=Sandaracinobacteroides sayramensis TaxID=2913411 RepID=UPI001EDADA68|nr:polysaccharide biosynthesis C-terminal domain-containing protein [Sandaracinobacteroides sayramensis]MCG2841759.1 hypothetical protein [Sandaracinobacteroides sayramensis]
MSGNPLSRLRPMLKRLWSPALLAYGIAGGVALASFLSTLLLAQLSGPAVIGQYAMAMSTATLLASFAVLGLERITIREIAGDLRQNERGKARAALSAIVQVVAVAAAATAAIYTAAVLLTPLVSRIEGDRIAMLIVVASILVWPLQRVGYSALRAAGMPVVGQLFEAMPTFLFTAGILLLFALGFSPTTPQAVGFSVLGQAVACVGAWLVLRPRMRAWGAPDRDAVNRRLLVAGLPLMATLFLQLFSDWLLLARISATLGVDETGAFRVSVQVITIIATIVSTTEAYVAARFAGDFRAGRPDMAWARHRRATLLMLGITAPAFLLLFLVPEQLLLLAFGPKFAVAATALSVMAAGQLINVLRGPLGSLLTMAGYERVQLGFTLVGLAMVVALALLLVPRHGLMGAAIAQVVPTIFRSVAGYAFARWRIPNRPAAAG